MVDHQEIIPLAAAILRDLADKPREQIHFTPEGIRLLQTLQHRGMVEYVSVSNLPEQNIWSITDLGIHWLVRHGLTSTLEKE